MAKPALPVAALAALLLAAACSGGDAGTSRAAVVPDASTSERPARDTRATTTSQPLHPVPDDDRSYDGDSAGAGAALGDQRGVPSPDPPNIDGEPGGSLIAVTPRDDARDYPNLQWALDNVAPGGGVELGPGAFFLGDGTTEPKHTLAVRRGVRISGVRRGDEWFTVVQGGGALDDFSALGGRLESGPFRVVNEHDDHPVVIEDIWMRHWTAEAVYVEASHGFALAGCRISDPVNTSEPGTRFVHAVFTSGEKARGTFAVEDNLVELGGYDGVQPHDEQLLGVFYSNHETVRVVGNTITGIDEAIEIIGNRAHPDGTPYDPTAAAGSVVVEGNDVDVTQTVDDTWPGRFALLIANNQGAQTVEVRGNSVTVRGKGWAMGLSGRNLRVTGNMVAFEEHAGAYPPGAVLVGFPSLGGFDLGAALHDSEFEGNRFSGSVTTSGILFTGAANDSSGNTFDLGGSLAALGALTTLYIAPGMHGNTFAGDLGTLVDRSTAGADDTPVG